jgi:ATP-dependent DNA helicase PIF1
MTQAQALAILKTGANVFLTGEPGSGKTHTVNEFVAWLRAHDIEAAVTASTGIAATHINGHTIHSWSGVGVRRELTNFDLGRIAGNKRVAGRVRTAHILIIDEISMLSAQTFALVEKACRTLRGGIEPFGGLQVVLVGDFFQLPPVVAREEPETRRNENDRNMDAGRHNADRLNSLFSDDQSPASNSQKQFAFISPAWNSLNLKVCYLSEQYRQDDPTFLEMLSAIRSGTVSAAHRELLRSRFSQTAGEDITQFFSHNADVDRINHAKLLKLSGAARTFTMESHGPKQLTERLVRGCLSPEKLTLKIGAHVMFTKNDTPRRRFVNGTTGTVTGFLKEDGGSGVENGTPIVETKTGSGAVGHTIYVESADWSIEEGGSVLARITQIPLRLAWAITVHKSQGMSLDAAHMDLSDAFEHGQGYVAISRVRTLAGLSLAGFNERALEVHPDIAVRDVEFREASLEVEAEFANIAAAELGKQHDEFVKACGGRV